VSDALGGIRWSLAGEPARTWEIPQYFPLEDLEADSLESGQQLAQQVAAEFLLPEYLSRE